eukprot:c5117_g1_i1.p1 GENE.c5117_g1_i1~~c5117_g1_i1.p1  ORF type:complete len:107 (+),score=28.70 c5117_g1_i1:58-378(+)
MFVMRCLFHAGLKRYCFNILNHKTVKLCSFAIPTLSTPLHILQINHSNNNDEDKNNQFSVFSKITRDDDVFVYHPDGEPVNLDKLLEEINLLEDNSSIQIYISTCT